MQPHSTAGHALAEPMEIDPIDAEERAKAAARRGTQDLGLLLLRVGIGAIFIAHGLQKAFGWWGGGGIDGFKTALADAGYQHAGILTYVGAGAQIAVGVLLVLGLFTPLAAGRAGLPGQQPAHGALGPAAGGLSGDLRPGRRRVPRGPDHRGGGDSPRRAGPLASTPDAAGHAGRSSVPSWRCLGIGGGIAAWVFLHSNNPLQ